MLSLLHLQRWFETRGIVSSNEKGILNVFILNLRISESSFDSQIKSFSTVFTTLSRRVPVARAISSP